MAIFIVLWPYLSTTKLRSVIRHNLGHSNKHVFSTKNKQKLAFSDSSQDCLRTISWTTELPLLIEARYCTKNPHAALLVKSPGNLGFELCKTQQKETAKIFLGWIYAHSNCRFPNLDFRLTNQNMTTKLDIVQHNSKQLTMGWFLFIKLHSHFMQLH